MKIINITDIQNDKQYLLRLHFLYVFISYIFVFQFLRFNNKYLLLITADIDS